jgi:hypothetical protein
MFSTFERQVLKSDHSIDTQSLHSVVLQGALCLHGESVSVALNQSRYPDSHSVSCYVCFTTSNAFIHFTSNSYKCKSNRQTLDKDSSRVQQQSLCILPPPYQTRKAATWRRDILGCPRKWNVIHQKVRQRI